MWHWIALATRFWTRAAKMGTHKLVHKTLKADIELMLSGCKKCWSYYLLKSLTALGVVQASSWTPGQGANHTVENILALDLQEAPVKAALKQRFDRIWEEVDLCVTISKLGQKVTLQGIEPGSLL
jgi:hypothetical protein